MISNYLKNFHFKKLILSISFILCLVFSWLLTITHGWWEFLDTKFYFWVNSFIETSYFWQNFWAIASHSVLDWIHDLVMIAFFLSYVYQKDDKPKLYKFSEVLFFSFTIAFSVLFINRYIFADIFQIHRWSPSLFYDSGTFLSEKVHWLKVKDRSRESYPGDHGTTALFFVLIVFHLKGLKNGIIAFLYSLYWQLPRLVTGSHWLTDLLMGSLTISAFIVSICIYTPIKKIVATKLYKAMLKILPSKGANVKLEES